MFASLRKRIVKLQQRIEGRHRGGRPVYTLLLGLMILLVTAVVALANPYQQSLASLLMFGLATLALLAGLYHGMSAALVMNAGMAVALLHLINVCSAAGGVYSPRMVWLMLVPVAAFYTQGLRVGLYWLLVGLLIALGLALWTEWQMAPPQLAFGADYATASLLSYGLAAVVLMSVPWLYDRMNERQLKLSRQRLRELQESQSALEQAVQTRERFIASVSHELRTPMNAILGLNALLLERARDKPQARKVLEYTRQSADHLMTVINDVLDYSQLSTGQLKAHEEVFELAATVHAAFGLFGPQVESSALDYRCEIEPGVPQWVSSDRHRLMQVLVNLLGNALKFTHQGAVVLQVQAQDAGVMFAVQDTGIGMSQAQQLRIFQRFHQADETIASEYGGSGLGLTISQSLVQMLGGRMGVQSQPGLGSRFWFWLPLRAVDAPQARVAPSGPGPAASSAQAGLRFLVVDDHPVNRLLVRQALQRDWPGSEVDESENGLRAVRRLQAGQHYDLVLMDLVMPEMDGIETTRWIRASEDARTRRTPVLGLTANVNAQDLASFEQAGLDALLLKPFEMRRLREEVARLVQAAGPARV